ncbi:hypothetical protein BT69DRAFT_1329669 [Atractiella rhizophila]|nr:hypothetical protein BT69DRAFT_1329669 [Atractiella rhizophila]
MSTFSDPNCSHCKAKGTVQYVVEASASLCIECGSISDHAASASHEHGAGSDEWQAYVGQTWINDADYVAAGDASTFISSGSASRSRAITDASEQRERYRRTKTLDAKKFVTGLLGSLELTYLEERAMWMLAQARKRLGFGWGKKGEIYAVACVCAALREDKKTHSIVELSDRADVDPVKVCRAYVSLKSTLNLKIDDCDPLYYVERELRYIDSLLVSLPPPPPTQKKKVRLNISKPRQASSDTSSTSTTSTNKKRKRAEVEEASADVDSDTSSAMGAAATTNLSPELHQYLLSIDNRDVLRLSRQLFLLTSSISLVLNRQPQQVAIALLTAALEGVSSLPCPNMTELNILLASRLKVSTYIVGERYRELCRVIKDYSVHWDGYADFLAGMEEKDRKGRTKFLKGGRGLVKREMVKLIKPVGEHWRELQRKVNEQEGTHVEDASPFFETERFKEKQEAEEAAEEEEYDNRSYTEEDADCEGFAEGDVGPSVDFSIATSPSLLSQASPSPSDTSPSTSEPPAKRAKGYSRPFHALLISGRPAKYVRVRPSREGTATPMLSVKERYGKEVEELTDEEMFGDGELAGYLNDEQEVERKKSIWESMNE